jgi:hypothetical protein
VRDEQNFDAVSDMHEKARMLREVLRIRKATTAIRIEATKLECECLRRLGQLGTTEKGYWGATARVFGAMPESEWAEFLDSVKDFTSPNSLRSRWEHQKYEADRQRRYRESADSGKTHEPYDFTKRPDLYRDGLDGFDSGSGEIPQPCTVHANGNRYVPLT